MAKSKVVNWQVEINALRDMCATASQGHRVAAEALWEWFRLAASRPDAVMEQKILTAKIAAESVAALEDLGALAWSVANREDGGILRNYLRYKPKNVHDFYKRVSEGENLSKMLRLTANEPLSDEDQGLVKASLAELERALLVAAKDYLALDGMLVRTYNKIKHGFVVIQRLDNLIPGATPRTNWQQHVNVLTGIQANGSVRYTDLERSQGMLESLMAVIRMSADTWRELASLVIYLFEHGVALDVKS